MKAIKKKRGGGVFQKLQNTSVYFLQISEMILGSTLQNISKTGVIQTLPSGGPSVSKKVGAGGEGGEMREKTCCHLMLIERQACYNREQPILLLLNSGTFEAYIFLNPITSWIY